MSEIKHTPGQMTAVRDALAASLGDTYDCTRVWSAWSVGTMSQDDFTAITEDEDRLQELTIVALDASGASELLEALESLMFHDGDGWNADGWFSDEQLQRARAAIAKATGSES